jgi:hypothetical protein
MEDDTGGPILFTGCYIPVTVTEMVREHMPPRPVADRLVARFFAGKEPAWREFSLLAIGPMITQPLADQLLQSCSTCQPS